mgnify:FL=1
MSFIVVLAKIQPKEGCHDSILELSEELIYESQLEDGNIEYELLQSDNDNSLTFVEKWESVESLKKHMKSPHFLNFNEDIAEFVQSEDIEVLSSEKIEL